MFLPAMATGTPARMAAPLTLRSPTCKSSCTPTEIPKLSSPASMPFSKASIPNACAAPNARGSPLRRCNRHRRCTCCSPLVVFGDQWNALRHQAHRHFAIYGSNHLFGCHCVACCVSPCAAGIPSRSDGRLAVRIIRAVRLSSSLLLTPILTDFGN